MIDDKTKIKQKNKNRSLYYFLYDFIKKIFTFNFYHEIILYFLSIPRMPYSCYYKNIEKTKYSVYVVKQKVVKQMRINISITLRLLYLIVKRMINRKNNCL